MQVFICPSQRLFQRLDTGVQFFALSGRNRKKEKCLLLDTMGSPQKSDKMSENKRIWQIFHSTVRIFIDSIASAAHFFSGFCKKTQLI